jgi:uncharacterized membrane protein YfcA
MEYFKILFPVSGVETYIFIPPLVAFVISFFCSMGGVTGAFLLLPFQMSFLNFTSPAVSATNFVFNIIAIPGGVYRFIREGRMVWPLAAVITAGSLPGLAAGYYIRVKYLPEPSRFKLFAGLVLLYISMRLLKSVFEKDGQAKDRRTSPSPGSTVKTISFSAHTITYEFMGSNYSFDWIVLLMISLAVGVVGGAYGIGGGAIIAPVCIALFRLPVYTTAGATLFSTFASSIAGVAVYSMARLGPGEATAPDWALGLLFGVGGLAGVYLGARCQKYIPQKPIRLMLGILIISAALKYIVGFILSR